MAKSKLARAFKQATEEERKNTLESRGVNKVPYLKKDFPVFFPREGDNEVRLVPPLADDEHCGVLGFQVWTYFILGRSWIAPNAFDKEIRNPLVDKYQQLKQVDETKAKVFMGTRKTFLFVLDIAETDKNKLLKLWAAGKTVMDSLVHLSKDRKTGALIPIEDPEKGRIVYFNKQGKGLQTQYLNFDLDDEFPLPKSILKKLYTMEELLEPMSVKKADEIIASFESGEDVSRDDSNSDVDDDREDEIEAEIKRQDEEVRSIAKEEASSDEDGDDDLDARITARLNKKK